MPREARSFDFKFVNVTLRKPMGMVLSPPARNAAFCAH